MQAVENKATVDSSNVCVGAEGKLSDFADFPTFLSCLLLITKVHLLENN
jgi:hypothetical protein